MMSVTTRPRTASPRNSSRSLVGRPPFSYANDRWVNAQTYSSSPPKRMPRAFSIGWRLLDLNDLTPTVVPAVLADGVRQLGLPALGAGRVGRGHRLPMRPAVPGLGPRRLTLGDGHRLPPDSPGAGRPGRPSGGRWSQARRARSPPRLGRRGIAGRGRR